MVPYQMTGLEYGAGQVGTNADIIANQKEDGADLMLGQEAEQLQGVRIIGAVIEGERDLVRIKAGNQGPAEELGGRIQSCIGIPTDREPGHQTSGNQFGIHASRV